MRPLIVILLFATLVPGAECAQETARSWPGLDASALSTVYVLDDTGVETAGRLLRLDPDSLLLLVDGMERRFETARIRRVDKRGDSLRNGALIGAIVGAAMGLVSGGISDCPGEDPGGECPGTRAAIFLFSTGVYAAVGTAIDALIPGRTTLYVTPAAGLSSDRNRSPSPHRGRAGINVSLAW